MVLAFSVWSVYRAHPEKKKEPPRMRTRLVGGDDTGASCIPWGKIRGAQFFTNVIERTDINELFVEISSSHWCTGSARGLLGKKDSWMDKSVPAGFSTSQSFNVIVVGGVVFFDIRDGSFVTSNSKRRWQDVKSWHHCQGSCQASDGDVTEARLIWSDLLRITVRRKYN